MAGPSSTIEIVISHPAFTSRLYCRPGRLHGSNYGDALEYSLHTLPHRLRYPESFRQISRFQGMEDPQLNLFSLMILRPERREQSRKEQWV
jgi:hypothetical protein